MKLLQELLQLNEASHAGRAWRGKLNKINDLLAWMYYKGILSPAEKKSKDSIFRQYYRYYNDGDAPNGVQAYRMRSDSKAVELELEEKLNTFLKKILSKYMPKINRADFRLDQFIKQMNAIVRIAKDADIHGLSNYWIKTVKLQQEDSYLYTDIVELRIEYDELVDRACNIDTKYKNMILSYVIKDLIDNKTITKEIESMWNKLLEKCSVIANKLQDIRDVAKQSKQLDLDLSESLIAASARFKVGDNVTTYDDAGIQIAGEITHVFSKGDKVSDVIKAYTAYDKIGGLVVRIEQQDSVDYTDCYVIDATIKGNDTIVPIWVTKFNFVKIKLLKESVEAISEPMSKTDILKIAKEIHLLTNLGIEEENPSYEDDIEELIRFANAILAKSAQV